MIFKCELKRREIILKGELSIKGMELSQIKMIFKVYPFFFYTYLGFRS